MTDMEERSALSKKIHQAELQGMMNTAEKSAVINNFAQTLLFVDMS